ncbi:glutamate receptor ionotropic, kainate 2-like [Diachasmimorpha longicaudata]|uniref:glutamate receptor ionotropic, kainate 2-like n=1 Tax=Diachasmimorpha longicaudata TaxID=58733 RepID=UPI0030B89688
MDCPRVQHIRTLSEYTPVTGGMNFVVFLFNIYIVMSAGNSAESKKMATYYGPLVKNIYEEYRTGGIMIASHQRTRAQFTRLTRQYEIARWLSKYGIPSIIVKLERFKERLSSYTDRIFRPLVAVGFYTMEEVLMFQQIAKDVIMGYPVWLIIFAENADADVCEYCRNPHGNLFNLKLDSEVLVLCCDPNTIDEWWSPAVNRTMRKEIGHWIGENSKGYSFSRRPLYGRRNSLEGRELRVVAAKGSAYIWKENGKYTGFFGEVLNELSAIMNFTISESTTTNGFGNFNPKTLKWNGVIGRIHRNEADIGVSPMAMTHSRLNAVDFTIPMFSGKSRLYVRKLDGARVQWQAYFKAFAMDVWMTIIGLIVAIPLLLTLIRYRRGRNLFPQIIEHYSNVWGIYCQQGLSRFPDETSLRIVYLSIFLSAVVSTSVYSASLVSFLTVFSSYSPFNTMEEFVADGTYGLLILKNSAQYDVYKNTKDPFKKKMKSLMVPEESLPSSLAEGFKRVCQERVVFETNEAIRKTMDNSIFCDITAIDTKTIETFGMITPRRSEYLELINYRIRQFELNGVFRRLKNKYFTRPREIKIDYPKVHVEGVEPILLILASGFSITLMIFIIELLFNWIQTELLKRKERRIIQGQIKYSRSSHRAKNEMYFIP